MAKVRFEITGDMVDGYAEIILGMMLFSGFLSRHKLAKRKNADGNYNLILDIEGNEPPLGSMGLEDIPHESN